MDAAGEFDLRAKLRFARDAVFSQLSGLPSLIRSRLTDGPRTPALATAHLLYAGAHLDVAGTRAGDLPRQTIREVVAKYPRDGFPACVADLMRREAAERPNSRAALLWRLGMRLPVTHNPLDRP